MKTFLLWVTVAALALGMVSGAAAGSLVAVTNPEAVADALGVQEGTEVRVGMTTATSGYFATNLWGANAADLSIRALLHGYSTVTTLRDGELMFDGMAIAGVQVTSDEHSRTYIISLMTDLTYNDGTPLTAKDYVFSLLLQDAPEIAALGGTPRELVQFVGYDAYHTGEAEGFAGIRLLSEDAFSLEIAADQLPYFYGIAMLELTPYPMRVIAPGCDILDDGQGCYIGRGAEADTMDAGTLGFVPGEFSTEMLEATLLNPETGYLFNPRVTSGPYQLEAYDAGTHTVSLVVNPRFLGNYEGQKPHIQRLTLQPVENAAVVEMLLSGEIDLANEIVDGAVIDAALPYTDGGDAPLRVQNYPRSGLAYLALACEHGPTADAAVRRAIAQCVDKDALIAALSSYALPVHGYYGVGQWMTTYAAGEDAEQALPAIAVADELPALGVAYDVEAAKATLSAAGWNLDAEGKPYAGEGVRHRQGGDGLEPLTLRWAKTQSDTADTLRGILAPALADAGFDLVVDDMPFPEVLQYFYRARPRDDYDMFFLASDFMQTFDPYPEYHTGDDYQGILNTSGLRSARLMELAKAMRETPGANQHLYALRWLAFQQAWAEEMPLVPLYSNIYFDFYAKDLQDYDIVRSLNWGYAMPYAWVGEPPAEEGDDAVVFLGE